MNGSLLDVSESTALTCRRCLSTTRALDTSCSFCAACGALLDTEDDVSLSHSPSTSLSEAPITMALAQAVVARVSRHHTHRLAAVEATQAHTQAEKDKLSRQIIVLEAQVEALRRLLRQSHPIDSLDDTRTELCADSVAAAHAKLAEATADTSGPLREGTVTNRLAVGRKAVNPSLVPAHYFSQSVATSAGGLSRPAQPPRTSQRDVPSSASAYRQTLLDQL